MTHTWTSTVVILRDHAEEGPLCQAHTSIPEWSFLAEIRMLGNRRYLRLYPSSIAWVK